MASVTIQRRPNGRFGVRLNRDDGRTRWVGTFDLRREAKAAGDQALSEYRAGRLIGPRRITLARYWDETLLPVFIDGDSKLADGTRASKRMIFRTYVLPDPIAAVPLGQITEEDLMRFRSRLRGRPTIRGSTLSPGSINNVMTQLAWAFNKARSKGIVSINPASTIKPLPTDHEPRFLEDPERERLLRAFRLDQDRRLAEFICETGLRKGEAFAVRIDQVDAAPLEIASQLRRDGTLGPLKNRKPRRVGLTVRARELLTQQRAWVREEWMRQGKGSPQPTDFLWPSRRLGPMGRETWDRAFNEAAALVRLPVTTHDLRHTYAATAIDAGLDIYTLARQLGDSLSVTERTYAHLYPEAHQRAAEVLDRRRERLNPLETPAPSSYLVAAGEANAS